MNRRVYSSRACSVSTAPSTHSPRFSKKRPKPLHGRIVRRRIPPPHRGWSPTARMPPQPHPAYRRTACGTACTNHVRDEKQRLRASMDSRRMLTTSVMMVPSSSKRGGRTDRPSSIRVYRTTGLKSSSRAPRLAPMRMFGVVVAAGSVQGSSLTASADAAARSSSAFRRTRWRAWGTRPRTPAHAPVLAQRPAGVALLDDHVLVLDRTAARRRGTRSRRCWHTDAAPRRRAAPCRRRPCTWRPWDTPPRRPGSSQWLHDTVQVEHAHLRVRPAFEAVHHGAGCEGPPLAGCGGPCTPPGRSRQPMQLLPRQRRIPSSWFKPPCPFVHALRRTM